MDLITECALGGVAFLRSVAGLVTKPYATVRRIADRGTRAELIYIGLMLAVYFGIASAVKVAAFRPFLLTRQFTVLMLGAAVNYAVMVGALWVTGAVILRARVRLLSLCISWAYTLVPTAVWFFMTSALYIILPPPRTTSLAGLSFSVLFIVVSATLLWWKVTLAYLTARFVFRFDLARIAGLYAVVLPLAVIESVYMYRLGVFTVPFL